MKPVKKTTTLSLSRVQLRQVYKVARYNETASAILLLTVCHLLLTRYGKRAFSQLIACSPFRQDDPLHGSWLLYSLRSSSAESLKEVLAIVQQELKSVDTENKASTFLPKESDDHLRWAFSFDGIFPKLPGMPECPVQVNFYRQPEEQLSIEIEHDTTIFSEETVRTFIDHFLTLIDRIDQAAGINVEELLTQEGITLKNIQNDDIALKIYEIWRKLLNRKVISDQDDFWAIGGNSLKAARLLSSLQQAFNTSLSYSDIMEYTTLSSQATLIRTKQQHKALPVIKQSAAVHEFPLSAMQRSIYSADTMRREESVYNLHVLFDAKGEWDVAALEAVVQNLVQVHESLRTVFEMNKEGIVQQRVLPGWQTVKLVKTSAAVNREAALALATSFIHHSFDVAHGPLLAVHLIRYGNSSLLLWVIHHLICDGASLEQLVQSFFLQYAKTLHNQIEDPHQNLLQFRDYIAWEQEITASGAAAAYKEFWQQHLLGVEQNPELFFMHHRPAWISASGKVLRLETTPSQYHALDTLKQATGVHSFVQILTALAIVLYKYTQHTDWVIGIPVNLRRQAGMEHMVGPLINTLPLRIKFSPTTTVLDLLKHIKQALTACQNYAAYPLEKIIENNEVEVAANRSPLFDMVVNYQYTESSLGAVTVTEGLSAELVWPTQAQVKYDMAFNFYETPDDIHGHVEYSNMLFEEHDIKRFVHHVLFILHQLAEVAHDAVGNLSLLQVHEKDRLLQWAGNSNAWTSAQTPSDLFRLQARQTPEQLAGKSYDGRSITYASLDVLSEKLSNYLNSIQL